MTTSATAGDKQPVILLLGNARPNEYGYFKESGLKIVLLHDRHCPVACPPREDFEDIIPTDFSGDEPLLNYRKLAERYDVTAQIAAVETAVLDNAKLAAHTFLAAPTVGAATLALNKAEMRKAFIEKLGADSTSQSAAIDSEADLERFAGGRDFPIVLKPTNLFGSMFVIISHTAEELRANYREMVGEIRAHLDAAGRTNEPVEVQAETFLDGTSHSIDCIVDARGEVHPTEFVDVLTERNFGIDKVQHYARFAPSLLSPQDQERNRAFCKQAVKALGLSCCVAHVEFIQTRQGPRLLEIAARPGGNRVHLMKEVFGIEMMALYLSALTSAQIHVAPKYVRPRAIVSVYPDTVGAFFELLNEKAIDALPGYVKHGIRVGRGETVGPAQEGFLPTLSIEIAADTSAILLERISTLRALGPLVGVGT
jgi:D-alanine-D-alanine ligase-like ATP-grasp enzyme